MKNKTRRKTTDVRGWMALGNMTSHFSTMLELVASASFLTSLSIIHGFIVTYPYLSYIQLFLFAVQLSNNHGRVWKEITVTYSPFKFQAPSSRRAQCGRLKTTGRLNLRPVGPHFTTGLNRDSLAVIWGWSFSWSMIAIYMPSVWPSGIAWGGTMRLTPVSPMVNLPPLWSTSPQAIILGFTFSGRFEIFHIMREISETVDLLLIEEFVLSYLCSLFFVLSFTISTSAVSAAGLLNFSCSTRLLLGDSWRGSKTKSNSSSKVGETARSFSPRTTGEDSNERVTGGEVLSRVAFLNDPTNKQHKCMYR